MNPKLHTTVTMFFWFITMLVLHFLVPIKQIIQFPLTFAGITICAIGIWLNVLCAKTLRDRNTPTHYATTPRHLVTTGPFSISRNPIYISTVVLLLGVAVVLGSISPLFGVLGWWLCLNFLFIPVEERHLSQVFGEEYAAYRAKVRRWF